MINWNAIKKFNYTAAIDGGAWLEDASGVREWVSFSIIIKNMGNKWVDRQIKKQGWMTGCWIECA